MKKLKIGEEFEVKEEGYLQSVIDEKNYSIKGRR
ncbi:hypothetical protein QOZ91_001801 [Clostridium sardiniense]|nr:hypothetical protein [Clostridium sardiniense]